MYYSKIRVDPTNPEIAYQGGAPFFKTVDGGKTWRQVQGLAHSDHHAIWVNPRDNNHLLVGNDGGLDVSYDQGDTWEFVNNLGAVGQFYKISADMRKPYYVCGGLQDNGSWCGPSAVRSTNGILNSDWFRIGGGDGFYTASDPTDWRIVYSESQDGATNRVDLGPRHVDEHPSARPARAAAATSRPGAEGVDPAILAQFGFGPGAASGNIVPAPPAGTNFRFYWNTPFLLSPHNPSTVYLGAERLFKSMDRGNTWVMSPDLTRNIGRNDRPIMGVDGKAPMASKHDGAAAVQQHHHDQRVAAGSRDRLGRHQRRQRAGEPRRRADVEERLRQGARACRRKRTSRASRRRPSSRARAYVTFDGHRTDDHKPYVFVTQDFGETWTSISSNLPMGNVNVITADNRNRNLLFLGTEYGIYVSMDAGKSWKRLMQGMPTVRVDDLIIHPRERDLIAGTHGRSIWILDDISALEAMNDTTTQADAFLFDVRPATAWINDIQKQITVGGAKHFRGQNPDPGTAISYWLKGNANDVKVTVTDITGREVRVIDGPKTAGPESRPLGSARGPPQGRGRGRGHRPGRAAAATAPARSRRRRTRRRRRLRRASRAPRVRIGRRRRPRRRRAGARRATWRGASRRAAQAARRRRRRWTRPRRLRAGAAGRAVSREGDG